MAGTHFQHERGNDAENPYDEEADEEGIPVDMSAGDAVEAMRPERGIAERFPERGVSGVNPLPRQPDECEEAEEQAGS